MKVLVTGAAGFIAGYLIPELLQAGHEVVGLDNFSKYGRLRKSYDDHDGYTFVQGDAKDTDLMRELAAGCDQIVAGAAMIGGISYFHEFAYDLLAENERILAATFDAAIHAFRRGRLAKITVISSSMVYESAGADVVAGSRYMKGGRQLGGPLLKRTLSRLAGPSLHYVAGIATHDPTNNFKIYSRRLLDATHIESFAGFELALELTVKAHVSGMKIAEVPTTWSDRTAGESRFRLWSWIPHYLRWYLLAMRWRLLPSFRANL